MLDGAEGEISLKLITAAGSQEEEVELSEKLEQVQAGAAAKKIAFSYTFDSSKHDRFIQTDTGWRITLGRGLDFFHRIDGRYSLGFIDQTQRKCKETNIVFTRMAP